MQRSRVLALSRTVAQLVAGLCVLAFGEVLIIKAGLGVIPWDVLNQGLLHRFGLTIGAWSIIVGAVVMALWIPLRERPGVGTVVNVGLTGFGLDFFSAVLPTPDSLAARVTFLVVGVVLNGVGTAAYIGSRLGSGPRDGLMTGLVRITGRSVRVVRTCIEIVVVAVGALLGGNLGIGTIVFALCIGQVIHRALPLFSRAPKPRPADDEAPAGCPGTSAA